MIVITDIQEIHIHGYHAALDSVAREKRFLLWTEAPSYEDTRAFVLNNIARGIPQIVALDHGKVIGWCDITPNSNPARMHCGTLGMGILKAHRSRGVGTRLIHEALARAKRSGLERVELEVFEENLNALQLYEKVGFILEGKKMGAVKIDGASINVLIMGLLLKDYATQP